MRPVVIYGTSPEWADTKLPLPAMLAALLFTAVLWQTQAAAGSTPEHFADSPSIYDLPGKRRIGEPHMDKRQRLHGDEKEVKSR